MKRVRKNICLEYMTPYSDTYHHKTGQFRLSKIRILKGHMLYSILKREMMVVVVMMIII